MADQRDHGGPRRDGCASFAGLVADNRDYLTELDAAIGDADHGVEHGPGHDGRRGRAGRDPARARAGALFTKVGMTLVSTVGGASGPLYGTFFLRMGSVARRRRRRSTPDQFAAALRAGLDGVVARGKAEAGDKTMFDALAPAVDALDAALGGRRRSPTALAGRATPPPSRPRRDHRRCWPARAGPAISASAASATRTPARPRSPCCCRRRPTESRGRLCPRDDRQERSHR